MSDSTFSTPAASASPFDVIVVGGGQAGLAVAYHLSRRGLRYLVLDSGMEIGHTWRGRWDSLRLFTPAEYCSLPGMPFPAPAGTYPTKDEVADYLKSYATRLSFRCCSTPRSAGSPTTGACSTSRQIAGRCGPAKS